MINCDTEDGLTILMESNLTKENKLVAKGFVHTITTIPQYRFTIAHTIISIIYNPDARWYSSMAPYMISKCIVSPKGHSTNIMYKIVPSAREPGIS